jgi:hypothetical protein
LIFGCARSSIEVGIPRRGLRVRKIGMVVIDIHGLRRGGMKRVVARTPFRGTPLYVWQHNR